MAGWIASGMLKERWYGSVRWLVRQLYVSFDIWVERIDYRGTCIVGLYNGNDDKCAYSNSRGISLLGIASKLYGKLLIKIVRAGMNVQ